LPRLGTPASRAHRHRTARNALDAGEASEERLLQAVYDLHANVIKVSHHGSNYASIASFASHVRSAFAVISVGRHNAFGHPARTTINTWQRMGTRVLRTDMCGAITIGFDEPPYSMIPCEEL
jgi:competence protein ComEC